MTDLIERPDAPASLNGKGHANGKRPALDRPAKPKNYLSPLGEKIFLDRYAWKDGSKKSLAVGDTVIVCVDDKTRQREIGTVEALDRHAGKADVRTRDGTLHHVAIEHVDKPLETTPGETMARIAKGIAAVEAEAKRAEWEEKFNWLLEDWKFVPGGRIWAGAGTDQQLTFYNCMPPDQEVLTEHGYKPIADIEVGEQVVTHRNRLRRVLHKFERETDEDMFVIKTRKMNYDLLRLTGEHKVLAIRSDWVNKHKSRDGLRLKQDAQWIPAKELQAGDFLAVAYDAITRPAPILYVSDYIAESEFENRRELIGNYALADGRLFKPQHRTAYHGHLAAGGTKYGITNRVEIDAELCHLFGRWLGDGNVNHRTGTSIPAGIKIVFSLNEKAEADHFAEIITRRFGIPTSVKLSSTQRWYDLWANSLPLGQFFKSLFGCYSYGKKIPSELMRLPDELSLELLRGLFGADGYKSANEIGILLANRTLAVQMHQLLLRLGYFFSIFENTHKNAKHPSYRLTSVKSECQPLYSYFFNEQELSEASPLKYYFEHNGLRWIRIAEISQERYKGTVLDLEVEEDHSFISAGLVVSNCYVIPSPRDSRGGIVSTLQQMMEIMSRGGGVGINVSSLRPRYSYVKGVNGRSSGAVSWGGLYSFVTGLIEQGGSRRGALMIICNDWHPDILEFIHSKREAGKITNANISVGISDSFMAALEADAEWDLVFPDTSVPDYDKLWDGDLEAWRAAGRPVNRYKTVRAREMWEQIIESAWASAEPGLWFRERSNKMSNSWYFSPLISTNPCVTGDTRIYTDQGLIKAIDLYEDQREIEVTIDGRFGLTTATTPATTVFKTGTMAKDVYRLQTKEGYYVRATADHRFMTASGWVELQHLKPGDKIHLLNRKGGFGKTGSLELGRVLGWLVGDGTIKADRAVLSFFGDEKRELAPLFAAHVNELVAPLTTRNRAYPVGVVDVQGRDEARVQSQRLLAIVENAGLNQEKHHVPELVFQGSEAMQRGFLQALFTADGSVQRTTTGATVLGLASSYHILLEEVQQLLANFGICSRIYLNRRPQREKLMPDGKGGQKLYTTKAQHELRISKTNVVAFQTEIGFLMKYKNDSLADRLAMYNRKLPRVESFHAEVKDVVFDGNEYVFDLTEPITHSMVVNGLVSHQCGEQPLPGFGICNLGAVNLSRFVENGAVQWDDLRQTVRYAVRFLDNVIDATPYFFEENAAQQGKERRVGLGVMGMAEMMIRLGLRYGSAEGNAFLDELFRVIASEAYLASSDYAAEKGAFPAFDAEKYLQSGYMQGMPEEVRERVREQGVRNVTLLTVAPTGCVAPDTLVSMADGLRPIVELGDRHGEQWQPMQRHVHTDAGLRETSHFFVNGHRPVRTVTTERGFTLTATPNHQIRVIDSAGDYVWRRMDALRPTDHIVLKKNTMGDGERVPLAQVEHGVNSLSDHCPTEMTTSFAELLGLYMGDGYLKDKGGIHMVVSQQDPDLLDWVKARLTALWGAERHTAVEERIGCWTVALNGRYIPRFFAVNGLAKPKGNHGEGAEGAFIPSAVLQGGRETVAAFLRGLFESDGTITRGTISVTSSSLRLVQQAQVALLALGIVSTQRTFPDSETYSRFGKRPRYELRILNRREAVKFVQQVGFLSDRKRAACADLGAMCDRGDSVAVEPLLRGFYKHSEGLPYQTRQKIRGQIANGSVTQRFVSGMVADHPALAESELAHLVAGDFFLDRIASMDEGMCDTFDLSVPDNHTYIANGFVSHNTTGTMTGTSTGVEPYYFWSYFRKSRLGMHEEVVDVVQEYRDQHGKEAALPDYFVTAMDLSPAEHVQVQAAVQRWVDSALSKTANVPNEYTVEQLADLYRLMYDLGCKGGTVYRDGSRDEQVLSVKKEEPKPEEAQPKATAPAPLALSPNYTDRGEHKRARPRRLRGATYFVQTPVGKAYVTVNRNGGNEPFEVFANVGKVGSEGAAMSEAIGRLVSLVLRLPSEISPSDRLEMVVDEMQGIGGSRSIGFGPNRVTSLPDALAQVLREDLEAHREGDETTLLGVAEPEAQQLNLLESGMKADLCPECGHASFVRVEGCKKCYSCGHSEC